MKLNRRLFLGASAATLAAPMVNAAAHGTPRVVVIGGGAGGGTAARYIAKDSEGAIDVTLIEPSRTYYTCFFSNLYLGGFRDFDSIGHGYDGLRHQRRPRHGNRRRPRRQDGRSGRRRLCTLRQTDHQPRYRLHRRLGSRLGHHRPKRNAACL